MKVLQECGCVGNLNNNESLHHAEFGWGERDLGNWREGSSCTIINTTKDYTQLTIWIPIHEPLIKYTLPALKLRWE